MFAVSVSEFDGARVTCSKAPEGFEPNWINTNRDEGWFTILRLYGPLEPILEKTWKPNDVELVK